MDRMRLAHVLRVIRAAMKSRAVTGRSRSSPVDPEAAHRREGGRWAACREGELILVET